MDKRSNNPSPDVPSSYEAKGQGGEAATPEKTDTSVCWNLESKGQLLTRCVSPCPIRYSPSLPLCLTWLMRMGELQVPRLICLSTVLHQSLACLEVSRKKTWGVIAVIKRMIKTFMKQHGGGYEEDKTQRERVTRSSCSVKHRATLETLSNDSTTISNICLPYWKYWSSHLLPRVCVCDTHSAILHVSSISTRSTWQHKRHA